MNFKEALTTHDIFTENRMPTHSTSNDPVLDLFFKLGASRNLSNNEILQLFYSAFGIDKLKALQVLFYNRDIINGQGERRSFRIIFKHLCENYFEIAKKNLNLIPKYGRWDDIIVCTFNTPCEYNAFELIKNALDNNDCLCAKWMPRENKSGHLYALNLMRYLKLSPKSYRKLLSKLTTVVETNMCSNNWNEINYNHVPSKASLIYRKAFNRHDTDRYSDWIESLKDKNSGNKINANAIFPHDIIKPYINGSSKDETIEAQWKALPNYIDCETSILPVCDTSGSMGCGDRLPMLVCVAFGIYITERNKGKFKDCFITFSENPKFQLLKSDDLFGKVHQLCTADWDSNTNFESVFRLILNQAVRFSLSEEEMPKTILVFSDMQFDQCVVNADESAMEMIRRMYLEAGYKIPNIVFWNLKSSNGIPVKYKENGIALVSGFSPSILKTILSTGLRPDIILNKTLEKYNDVSI